MLKIDLIPEKACLLACLERAILDAAGSCSEEKKRLEIKCSALHWLFRWHERIEYEPFSFPWVCEGLEVCPRRTRAAILRLLRSKEKLKRASINFPLFVRKMLLTTATNKEVYIG